MCLNKIKVFPVRKDYGYKWLRVTGKRIYSPINHTGLFYKKRKWYTAVDYRLTADDAWTYNSGFHIYYVQKEARKSFLNHRDSRRRLFKVKFKDYITGYGDGHSFGEHSKQIVAQQMLIIKKVK